MPKIVYMENPFGSKVILDEEDLEILRKKIVEDEDSETSEDRIQRLLDYHVASLAGDHTGDCICVPCTCCKCIAEHYLDINTIPNLYKHDAAKINSAFSDGRNISQAIEWLAGYEERLKAATPGHGFSEELWKSCIPRWTEEGERAYRWLKEYRDKHFPVRE